MIVLTYNILDDALCNSRREVSRTSDSFRNTVICPTDNSSIGINLQIQGTRLIPLRTLALNLTFKPHRNVNYNVLIK